MDPHTPSPPHPSSPHHPSISPEPHRVLLLLDCQAGMLAPPPIGVPNAQIVRKNIEEVLEEARRARPRPLIVHMRNNGDVGEPDESGTPGWELVFRPGDGEGVADGVGVGIGIGGKGAVNGGAVNGVRNGGAANASATSGGKSADGGKTGVNNPNGVPTSQNRTVASSTITSQCLQEIIIDKRKNNAFRGTPLAELVPATAEIVIVGFQTDHSIRATCQEGVKRGNEVLLIRGAHATHDRIEVLYGGGTTPASRIESEVENELEDMGVHILDMKDLPGIFMDR